MNIEPADVRARKVYTSNKYFVLATQDVEGPWAAALAYTYIRPNFLCFFSQRKSRHGLAIEMGGPIAGVFYDSRCTFEEVESIQFSGQGELSHSRDFIKEVLTAGRGANETPVSDEEIERHFSHPSAALYRITIEQAWVLNQRAFADSGVDAREAVSVLAIFDKAGV